MAAIHSSRLPHPPLLQQFPFSFAVSRLAPGDIRATDRQRKAFLAYRTAGDPAADAVVSMFRRLPTGQGRALFEKAVVDGIDTISDPPAELAQFFAEVESVPYWLDRDKLDLAARTIGRTGAVGSAALSMALMGGYLAARVTKPLVMTGDLTRMAPRRLAETLAWHAAATAPGGLELHAPGYQATLRVRIMHATVRAGLRRRRDWDSDRWGEPIDQSAMSGTLMLFGLVHILGSRAGGLRFTAAEREAIFHLWRYVGHLLGVAPQILPASEQDWWKLAWLQADLEFQGTDNDSVDLAHALISALTPMTTGTGDGFTQRLRRGVSAQLLCGYAQLVLGRHNADLLGLPRARLAHAAVLTGAAGVHVLEHLRPLLPGVTAWIERAGRRSQTAAATRALATFRGDTRYDRHDQLAVGRSGRRSPRTSRTPSQEIVDG